MDPKKLIIFIPPSGGSADLQRIAPETGWSCYWKIRVFNGGNCSIFFTNEKEEICAL